MRYLLFLSLFLIQNLLLPAQNDYVVYGRVTDEEGNGLAGATIKVSNIRTGTYAGSKGYFKLPLPKGEHNVQVSSVGYFSKQIIFNSDEDSVFIELKTASVKSDEVVIHDDQAEEVIRKAIEKKQKNSERIKTLTGQLYSKVVLELGGDIFEGEGSKLMEDVGPEKVGKEYTGIIMETISKDFRDFEKDVFHTHIVQRRQTSNMPSESNVIAFSTFINFYANDFVFMTTNLKPPLADDAIGYYDYKIKSVEKLDDKIVFVIKVSLDSDLYPGLVGEIKIVDGSYSLIEVDLKPSEATAIAFVDDLHFVQRFQEIENNIWYPNYLKVDAKINVEIIKGLFSFEGDINATSMYTDLRVNIPLPDSIYREEIAMISVDSTADSTRAEFWETNTLMALNQKEKDLYAKVDSLVTEKDSTVVKKNNFDWDLMPNYKFDRVNSSTYGGTASISLYGYKLSTFAAYSSGQEKLEGSIRFNKHLFSSKLFNANLRIELFSESDHMGIYDPYLSFFHLINTTLLHTDYYNYFKKEGFELGLTGSAFGKTYRFEYRKAHNSSMSVTSERSLFSKKEWRCNPKILDGSYWHTYLSLGEQNVLEISNSVEPIFDYRLDILYGKNYKTDNDFYLVSGFADLKIPIYETGYGPILIALTAQGGYSEEDIPIHYKFAQETRAGIFASRNSFLSGSPSYYGGNKFYAFHSSLDLSDFLWRAIGLPKFNDKRGVELALNYKAGRYINDDEVYYLSTGEDYYQEIGLTISRIPLLVSNLIYGQIDIGKGIGTLADDNFGIAVNVSFGL